MKKTVFHYVVVTIAGGLVPYAFAPYGYDGLAILALMVLFYYWSITLCPKTAFIFGYLFGFAMFGIGVNWLQISINLFGGVHFIAAWFFTYLLVAFIALYPAVCGYLLIRYFKRYYLMALASLWFITEWCRGWFLGGFPWLNIGTSQIDSPLAGFIPIVGDYGVGFILCLFVSALICLIRRTMPERLASILLLVTISIACLVLQDQDWTQEIDKPLEVALIQAAIPQEIKWQPAQRQKTYALYTELSEPYWDSDLIIWPETAIPAIYDREDDFIGLLSNKAAVSNALLLSGLVYQDQISNDYFNSILLIDQQHHFYHKHHLVPFGEYLPLKSLFGFLFVFLNIPMSDFSQGDFKQEPLATSKGLLGLRICYEVAYSAEVQSILPSANILINVSNDAWFGDSMAPHQHLQIARMRALESGRYLLRATNTGISAIIDQRGRIVSRSPQFEPHALAGSAKLFEGATPYNQYGNKPIWLLVCISLLMAVLLNKRQT